MCRCKYTMLHATSVDKVEEDGLVSFSDSCWRDSFRVLGLQDEITTCRSHKADIFVMLRILLITREYRFYLLGLSYTRG